MGVKDTDRGYKALVDRVFGIKKPVITVGVFESDGAQGAGGSGAIGGTTVMQVAIWNEFGTDRIPERSFIRAWFDENEDKCREAVRAMAVAIVAGKYTKQQALNLLAQRFVAEIQKRIAAGISPANEPATVAAKGSSKPLIDTGQLRSSISYAIDGKQGKSLAGEAREKSAKAGEKALKKADTAKQKAANKASKKALKDAKRATKKATRSIRQTAKRAGRSTKRVVKGAYRDTKRAARRNVKKAYRAAKKAIK